MAGGLCKFCCISFERLSHMDLQASLLRQLENKSLSPDQQAELRCQIAREYEDAGRHEAALQAMGELWQRIGEHPSIEGLEPRTAAEVLLRAGVLTSWFAGCRQIEGAQETARDLMTESLTIFQSFKHGKKIAEAQTELAWSYFKDGRYDEARVMLQDALARLETDSELKALAVLRGAIIEWGATRHNDSLRILTEAAPLFEKINKSVIKGSYHNQLAGIFQALAEAGQRDYLDRAFIEYEAASFHFEEAGHKLYLANVENNLGHLYFLAHRFKEAHRHLDYARRLMVSLKDRVHVARVDETRARVFLAEGRNAEAEKVVKSAVSVLEQSGHHSLAEALITHGRALARLGKYDHARFTLQRAIEISEESGAINRAGEAALVIIKELGGHFEEVQLLSAKLPLVKELRRYEHDLIKQALISSSGIVSNAAHLLGTSHQHLIYIIEHRHTDLIGLRTKKKERPKRK
jgi:tetratricopeptide (TPR) repeat protein